MEQKRILWIVAAVGIFLLVVIGSTLILYAPQNNSDPVMVVESQNGAWINPKVVTLSNELKTSEQDVQSERDVQSEQDKAIIETALSTIEGDTSATGTTSPAVSANSLQANDVTVISNGNTTVYSADGVTTIDLNTTTKNTVQQVPFAQTEKAVTSVTTRSTASKPSSTTPPKVSSSPPKVSPAIVVKPAPVKTSVAALVVPQKSINQYWVQAASFISKANAEKARSALSQEKIPAELFTHADTAGITYYRLRVGPYTTKSEAEYWNSLIKLIDNFASAQSYVTNSTAPQA